MAYSIQVPDRDWSEQQVALDGNVYTIELRYKERLKRWFLTLKGIDGTVHLNQKKCVVGQTLTGLFPIPDFGGNIYVECKYGLVDYPSRDNFGPGKEVELLYLPDAEYSLYLRASDLPNKNLAVEGA